jgi:hypothetical protein
LKDSRVIISIMVCVIEQDGRKIGLPYPSIKGQYRVIA